MRRIKKYVVNPIFSNGSKQNEKVRDKKLIFLDDESSSLCPVFLLLCYCIAAFSSFWSLSVVISRELYIIQQICCYMTMVIHKWHSFMIRAIHKCQHQFSIFFTLLFSGVICYWELLVFIIDNNVCSFCLSCHFTRHLRDWKGFQSC